MGGSIFTDPELPSASALLKTMTRDLGIILNVNEKKPL